MTKSRTNADNVTADIAGITAGTGITGGGTSGTVTITNDMATTIAAKGDILAGTANDAYSALTVGANGTVLTAASGQATGLQWATPSSGGMTLISTTTLTGASVVLSSIPQTYNDLRIYIQNYKPSAVAGLLCRVNGLTSSIYRENQEYSEAGADERLATGTKWEIAARGQNTSTSEFLADYVIPNYTNTTTWKYVNGRSIANNQSTATSYNFATFWAPIRQTDAITSLTFFPNSGNFTSGTILLYGVK